MAHLKRPPTLGQEKKTVQTDGCGLARLAEGCSMRQERWSMSFGCLLEDRDGVLAFRQYLEERDRPGAKVMSMLLILNGLDKQYTEKRQLSSDKLITWLIKVSDQLLKNIFADNSSEFHANHIRLLSERLKSSKSIQNAEHLKHAFDASQHEVKNFIENNQYKNFINSDMYRQFTGAESESEQSLHEQSISRYMPTLPEHKVVPTTSELTPHSLAQTAKSRSSGATLLPHHPNPYYADSTKTYYVPTASHNDSEHASQSSDCTSDSISFTTETSSLDPKDERYAERYRRKQKIEKRNRKRMIQANNDNFGRSFVLDRSVQVTDPSDTEMATKTPHKFHAILCDKLETVLRNQQMELREQQMKEHDDDALEDDAILTEHIAKNFTPTNGTPTNGRIRGKALNTTGHAISNLVSNTHSQTNSSFSAKNSSRDHKPMLGTLPTTSTTPGTGKKPGNAQTSGQTGANDMSQDVQLKVGAWLETSIPRDVDKRPKSKRQGRNGPNYNYQTNGRNANQSLRRPPNFNPSTLSIDSGLSSTRIDPESEAVDSEAQELKGIKDRLIQETEGDVNTKLLYHFNNEKFVIRVPGRPPILSAFRQKFHQKSGSYRFFFKSVDTSWVEITDVNEPLPVIEEIVEAKVIDAA